MSSQRRDLRAMDSREGIRHHDETAIRFSCLCDDRGFKLGGIADPCYDCLDCEGCSGGLERGQEIFGIWRCRWIEYALSSSLAAAGTIASSRPGVRAAASTSLLMIVASGLVGLTRSPMVVALGSTSCRSCAERGVAPLNQAG